MKYNTNNTSEWITGIGEVFLKYNTNNTSDGRTGLGRVLDATMSVLTNEE
jgi:hypothetical protein